MMKFASLRWILFFIFYLLIISLSQSSKIKQKPNSWASVTGYSNNLNNPDWGIQGAYFRREGDPHYENVTTFTPIQTINSRNISNYVFDDKGVTIPSPHSLSILAVSWGQFLTHDICYNSISSEETRYITIPDDDEIFPSGYQMPFNRSVMTYVDDVPSFPNLHTAFIDASNVYGSTQERFDALRDGAFLRYHEKDGQMFLPINSQPDMLNSIYMDNNAHRVPTEELFAAGDVRASENPILTCLHTIFLREHNRLAQEFLDKGYSEEQAFFETRRWITAYIQSITLYEYYPVIIGEPILNYTGYDPNLRPETTLFFESVSFRYGHSEVPEIFSLLNEERQSYPERPSIPLREAYFFPYFILQYGIEPFIRGAAAQMALDVDVTYTSGLRNFLFGNPGKGGHDLGANNIERGREHGIPTYNEMRKTYKLMQYQDFDSFPAASEEIREALREVYNNDISLLDAYVGGLAEKKTSPRSVLGPLFKKSVELEYQNKRNSDRFYFENEDAGFTKEEISIIKQTKLSDIILRNTDIKSIQCGSFIATYDLDCGVNSNSPINSSSSSIVTLDGDFTLSWSISGESITFQMEAITDGWVGLSFPERKGYMLKADAIIGWVSGSDVIASDYYIESDKEVGCTTGVCRDDERGGSISISDVSGNEVDGKTTIKFTRPLRASDSSDRAISKTGEVYINVAFGSTDSLSYHTKKGGLVVNLETGESNEVSLDKTSINVHAVLMFISWAVIFPFGILIVRFGKQIFPAWWFRGHMFLQFSGLIFVLLALMFAIHYISDKGSEHFHTSHEQLGLATIILSIITPSLGQITAVTWKGEREEIPFFPDKLHWILGYISCLMAFVNFGLGLHEYGSDSLLFILCYVWVGVTTVGYICFYIYNSRKLVDFGSDSEKEND